METIKIIRLCNYWNRAIIISEIQKGVKTMKKFLDRKRNAQSLSQFSGVSVSEKHLYWSTSPWSAFWLLVKKQG